MKVWIIRDQSGGEYMRIRAFSHDEIVIEREDISRLPGKYSFRRKDGVEVKDATLFVSSHTGAVYHCSDADYVPNWLSDDLFSIFIDDKDPASW
jgi:hypothetical protein